MLLPAADPYLARGGLVHPHGYDISAGSTLHIGCSQHVHERGQDLVSTRAFAGQNVQREGRDESTAPAAIRRNEVAVTAVQKSEVHMARIQRNGGDEPVDCGCRPMDPLAEAFAVEQKHATYTQIGVSCTCNLGNSGKNPMVLIGRQAADVDNMQAVEVGS